MCTYSRHTRVHVQKNKPFLAPFLNVVHHTYDTYIHTTDTYIHIHEASHESFSARVGEVTHPKLPIYSLEIYYNSKL